MIHFTHEQISQEREEIIRLNAETRKKYAHIELNPDLLDAIQHKKMQRFDKYCQFGLWQFCQELSDRDDEIESLKGAVVFMQKVISVGVLLVIAYFVFIR